MEGGNCCIHYYYYYYYYYYYKNHRNQRKNLPAKLRTINKPLCHLCFLPVDLLFFFLAMRSCILNILILFYLP